MPTTFINNKTFIRVFIFSCNHQTVLDVDKVNDLCLRFFSLRNTKDSIISEILCNLSLGAFIALPK